LQNAENMANTTQTLFSFFLVLQSLRASGLHQQQPQQQQQ
jgi:hypothetical protein